jgi:glycosyltransferase involved in cell wall biosynthesis
MRTVAIIPAFNEEYNIGSVVKETLKYVDVVYVIDNNSSDNTAGIARESGAISLIEHDKGAGAATSHGWKICKWLASIGQCDVVVTLDGDGQHDPADIPRLIEPILKNDADVVLGSRFIHQGVIPPYRKFGNDVITLCSNIYYKGDWVTDAQCGMRAFGKIAIVSMDIEEKGFGLIVEAIMKSRQLGLRIAEVPVQCIYRGLDQDSTMNPVIHGISILLGIVKWRLKTGV